eukprot:Hpha_TRINITY_DN14967_c1_g2::TRINITY_DN14967_c1_g2_i2::g.143271::m.143271/K13303/SGK2; serum/glucocorticoid-regulated kinase 2
MSGLLLFARVSPELASGEAAESLAAVELDPGGTVGDILLELERSGALSKGAHAKVEWQGVGLEPDQPLADAGLCPESVVLISKGISLDDFERVDKLGKGAYGYRFVVVRKDTQVQYAMKTKLQGLDKELLLRMEHPFITRVHWIFPEGDRCHLLLDYIAGGELFYYLSQVGQWGEDRSKFYAAQVATALDYMHGLEIAYHDLQPEACVLGLDGYCVLTSPDCFLDRRRPTEKYFGGGPSPEYLAPEILTGVAPSGMQTDWWTFGIFLYEMIHGLPPFYSENINEMYEMILKKELVFEEDLHNGPPSQAVKGICTRLLDRNPSERLQSLPEIKAHPFYEGWDWELMARRGMTAPFLPEPFNVHSETNREDLFSRAVDMPFYK